MDVVGELAQLTALDLSSLFNATGEARLAEQTCRVELGEVGQAFKVRGRSRVM